MTPDNLEFFARVLQKRTGVSIGSAKAYLVESRLAPVASRYGLANSDDVVAAIRAGKDLRVARDALEAMMTHESLFFRDIRPFDDFRNTLLPRLVERRAEGRRLRIWCAAASTGQEPYSLAMTLQEEAQKLAGWSVEIVATDIAPGALAYARDGLYSHFEAQRGLPVKMLIKYFTKEGSSWRLAPQIRSMVTFREFNLLDDPSTLGAFDIVFCRNVLIYFEQSTKAQVLERVAKRLPTDGYLLLGAAETVIGITTRFAPMAGYHGVYTLCREGAVAVGA